MKMKATPLNRKRKTQQLAILVKKNCYTSKQSNSYTNYMLQLQRHPIPRALERAILGNAFLGHP